MALLGGLVSELIMDVALTPDDVNTEPNVDGSKNPAGQNNHQITDEEYDEEEEEEDEEEEEEEEEELPRSAHLEPSTLPWPGDLVKKPQVDSSDGVWPEKGGSEGGERGGLELPEKQTESHQKNKSEWRESMPEGERWEEMEVHQEHKEGGSQADDEEEEDDDDEIGSTWTSEKTSLGITPRVTILRQSCKKVPEESHVYIEKFPEKERQEEAELPVQYYPQWKEQDDKYYLCDHVCGGKRGMVLSLAVAGILFPLLVWGGYELLPFDLPLVDTAPLRVIYTLRCAFFAIIPILLGVLVQGVARLRYSELKPLYQSSMVNREVAVHWHFVNESLALFLFYFLQLAVMATYVSQDMVKLVPLLTIIFVFGRLIYWLCLSLGSSIRAFGFGFSFYPIVVMFAANLYFICSSVGQESVFDVEPPITAPPPRQRFWG